MGKKGALVFPIAADSVIKEQIGWHSYYCVQGERSNISNDLARGRLIDLHDFPSFERGVWALFTSIRPTLFCWVVYLGGRDVFVVSSCLNPAQNVMCPEFVGVSFYDADSRILS